MKITSRLGVLLAQIAGKEDSLDRMVPPWATNAEEELMLDIADRVDGLEAGAVPEVATADKGKYLHANEDTGALEWAEAGDVPEVATADKGKFLHANEDTGALEWAAAAASDGSGNFVIHFDSVTGTLDKTWQEIADAYSTGNTVVMINDRNEEGYRMITSAYVIAMTSAEGVTLSLVYVERQENQGVITYQLSGMEFVADSTDDYPTMAPTGPVQH